LRPLEIAILIASYCVHKSRAEVRAAVLARDRDLERGLTFSLHRVWLHSYSCRGRKTFSVRRRTDAEISAFVSDKLKMSTEAQAPLKSVTVVRVEDSTSVGRSYSARATTIAGMGAKRRALRTRSFAPYADGKLPTLESSTMAYVNLKKSSRGEVLAYFLNTWELTDTLFSALRDDSVFYSIPDKLRRPLIFYFGHPAALYLNKMHQAGLIGE
jgi:hypothetical protein